MVNLVIIGIVVAAFLVIIAQVGPVHPGIIAGCAHTKATDPLL